MNHSHSALELPEDLDATNWQELEPLFRELVQRPIASSAQLEQLLLDRSELDAAVLEAQALAYIQTTRFTKDTTAAEAYRKFTDEIDPKAKKAGFEIDRKVVASPFAAELDSKRYEVLLRDLRANVGLFREENLPLDAEDHSLRQEYNSIIGSMSVEVDGKVQTLQQASLYFDGTDRELRREAWVACGRRRLEDRQALNELFDRQIVLRTKVARNAGFENYLDYAFALHRRFDYTAVDCEDFHRSIADLCTPLYSAMLRQREEKLGLETLHPWDVHVDLEGGAPLRPYSSVEQLVEGTSRIFHRVDPELGVLFDTMRDGESFDLDSREGKADGGYQTMLDRSRKPFIFMNAAGTDRDLQTMIHEGGHAMHSLLCKADPLRSYRDCCSEFCEVASMAMELFAHPHLDEFYDPECGQRSRRGHLQGIVKLLPFVAQIDAFQHWLYTNPDHTHAERDDYWVELDALYRPGVSWEGVEDCRRSEWHRIPHLFIHPFYMIEYGIAQLGALGLWQQSLESTERALSNYKRALTLGGSRPLPELFQTAGLEFDFSKPVVGRLMRAVQDGLERCQ